MCIRDRPLVVQIGLDYQVGVGGARLAVADRQKIAIVRALLKRPLVLVLDRAASVLDPAAQVKVLEGILAERKGQGVVWALQRPELADRFGTVLVLSLIHISEPTRLLSISY